MNQSVRSSISSVKKKFEKAYSLGSSEGIAALYSEDAILFPVNGTSVLGRSSIKDFYADGFAKGARDFVFKSMHLYHEENSRLVTELGRYKYALSTKPEAGYYMIIWKQEGNGWSLYRDMWTSQE